MFRTRTRARFAVPVMALAGAFIFMSAGFAAPGVAPQAFADEAASSTTQEGVTPNAEVAEDGYTFGVGADLDKAKVTFTDQKSQVYTGKAIEPKFTVTLKGKKLKGTTDPEDTSADYFYFYMDNVTAGKGVKDAGGIPGIETATGPHVELITVDDDQMPHVKVKCFTIKQAPIKEAKVKMPSQVYTGAKLKPAANVKFNGMTLKQGTDYTLKYSKNVKVGTAKATVIGKGMYKGKKTVTFKIKKASIANAKFSTVKPRTYTGRAIEPKVTVKYKGKKLKQGKNYTVTYSKNVNAGVGKIKIEGKGDLKGTHTIEFVINARPIKNTKLKMGTAVWTGGFVTPSVRLTYKGKALKSGKDYAVHFANNTDVGKGTARAYIYARGNYTGSYTVKFSIARRPITSAYGVSAYWLNSLTRKIVEKPVYLAGSKPKPAVAYKGRYLKYGRDYGLEWTEPANAATAGGTGTVTIIGKGSYQGSRTLTYSILGNA